MGPAADPSVPPVYQLRRTKQSDEFVQVAMYISHCDDPFHGFEYVLPVRRRANYEQGDGQGT
jgi:hypothetical protein